MYLNTLYKKFIYVQISKRAAIAKLHLTQGLPIAHTSRLPAIRQVGRLSNPLGNFLHKALNNIFLKCVFGIWLCCLCSFVTAQNPFELEHRQEEKGGELNRPLDSANPFEKNQTNTLSTPIQQSDEVQEPSVAEKKKPSSSSADQFKFWLMTISLVLLTLLVTLYKSLVSKAYRAFINENFLKMIHRNEGRIVSIPYLLLYGLYLLNMAIFIYLTCDHFGWELRNIPQQQFFLFLLGTLAVFLMKHIVLMLLGVIFPIAKALRQYSFTIVIFNVILGIALIPFNLFIAFTAVDLARVLIYMVLALVTIFYLYRAFRGLLIAGSYMSLHKFHFFMYLCTVEIAPVLLLIGLITPVQ